MPYPQPQGFLAVPATGKGPGVLVLHPWWGLNETMKSLCGRLAKEGFIAFAPDLYHGKVAATIKDAETLSTSLREKRAKADVADAAAFLSERADPSGQGLYEPASEVSSLENALRTAGRPVTFHTYAGTGHWFFEQDRSEAYNEVAAKLAWERTLAFLREELPV